MRDWSLAILGALRARDLHRGVCTRQQGGGRISGLSRRRWSSSAAQNLATRASDVLTRLIQGEENGERLSEKELLHNCIFLLNAGHETTTNLIGNGLVALSDHPEQKQRLIAHPDADQDRGRGDAALKLEPSSGNHFDRRGSSSAALAMPSGTPTLAHQRRQRDPIPAPRRSTSPAPRTATSPSAPAPINAPAWRWRGWKRDQIASSRAFRLRAGWRAGARRRVLPRWLLRRVRWLISNDFR